MFSFINPRNAVLAFAFAGFAGIGMSSFASQASAGMLDECHASSKMKVVACCKQHIERFGRPMWMSNGEDSNCRTAAIKCVSKSGSTPFAAVAYVAKRPYCFLEVPVDTEGGGNNPNNPGTPGKPGIRGSVALTHG